jgi:hypothetical protein
MRFFGSGTLLLASLLAVIAMRASNAAHTLHLWANKFHLSVVDDETGDPVPVRMTLQRSNGKQVPIRRATAAGVGWAFDGELDFDLAPDVYQFEISHGPEFKTVRGSFTIDRNALDEKVIRLPRIASMSKEGWIAGDPLVAVPERDTVIRMRAEGLDTVASTTFQSTTPSSPNSHVFDSLPANIRFDIVRGTGTAIDLLALNMTPDSKIDYSPEGPSSDFVRACIESVKQSHASSETDPLSSSATTSEPKFVLLNPMAWDTPILLANQRIDAVGVFGEYLQLNRKQTSWRESRPPYGLEFSDNRGVGIVADSRLSLRESSVPHSLGFTLLSRSERRLSFRGRYFRGAKGDYLLSATIFTI